MVLSKGASVPRMFYVTMVVYSVFGQGGMEGKCKGIRVRVGSMECRGMGNELFTFL